MPFAWFGERHRRWFAGLRRHGEFDLVVREHGVNKAGSRPPPGNTGLMALAKFLLLAFAGRTGHFLFDAGDDETISLERTPHIIGRR